MPSRTLPTFTRAEVEAHNSKTSCYVSIGNKVYDVTDFADDHPGGADLVLDYAGRDIEDILKDPDSHEHSEAAYDVLDDSLVGFLISEKSANGHANGNANGNGAAKVANGDATTNGETYIHPRTGMSCAEDLSKDTDFNTDYKKHKFLDLSRPLFPQIWFGGFSKEFYLDQVHRPRHYKGGESAPLFGNFLEPLSKTPWWVIPTVWGPCVVYAVYMASQGYDNQLYTAGYFVFGFWFWSIIEYVLHRFLFHLDYYLPDNRVGITLHFLLHGIHHYLPMDKYRLSWLTLSGILLMLSLPTAGMLLPELSLVVFFGYICYDLTHYFLHHQNLPLWYKELKKYHLAHHFLDYELGFGVTSKFWDSIFGTELVYNVKKTN
ncbi:hypothetical protein CEP52_012059 [Fusarium oligoseptatum]|uniref:Ceramide very long chain fatty acid hydroxylase n=1 Tax=Fusarium oligoseptatum TaxID=2604345 RepID=A0A428T0A5_9HYPO|nr:hypothetical protein CEP52_012059 [Fusarium oligoseptatum]